MDPSSDSIYRFNVRVGYHVKRVELGNEVGSFSGVTDMQVTLDTTQENIKQGIAAYGSIYKVAKYIALRLVSNQYPRTNDKMVLSNATVLDCSLTTLEDIDQQAKSGGTASK